MFGEQEMFDTHFSLLVLRAQALAFQNSKLTVEQQITEAFDSMALPILHERLELFNGFNAFFPSNSIVGSCED